MWGTTFAKSCALSEDLVQQFTAVRSCETQDQLAVKMMLVRSKSVVSDHMFHSFNTFHQLVIGKGRLTGP